MATTDRVPPQSLESERALLGALLLKPDAIHDVLDLIHPESFYAEKHRLIFGAMHELAERGEPIDLLTLSQKMQDQGLLERSGGRSYLAELAGSAPAPGNFSHYAELVSRKSLMRSLIDAAYNIGELAYDEARDTMEVLDEAEKSVYAIGDASAAHKFTAIGDKIHEAWDRIEALSKREGGIRGVPSGFPDLDNLLSGFHPSDLVIIAARPSMGKTSLALDIARNAAVRHNVPVGIFSLEMSSEQLIDRMLAAESFVNSWKLRTGQVKEEDDFNRIRDALESLSKAPIFIDDKPGNNILAMRAVARRLKRDRGIGLIIVDYLQLMSPTSTKTSDSLVQQVTEISRSLKSLARELKVPVIALSQLSRAVEQRGGKPRLSDLRDSGCLIGDTLIERADTGERIQIKELVGQTNIPVVSLDGQYQLRPMLASRIFSNGIKETFLLTLRSGRTIKSSGNHKFLTLAGWQRLDALQDGDRLASPRLLKPSAPPSTLSTNELLLLAHLLGDGCVLPRQPIHYTSADEKNLDAVERAARKLFGIAPRRVKQKNWWHSYLPSPHHLTHGRPHPITSWYRQLGIAPVRSYEKRVPQAVFAADSISIQLFLHHLWATDGNISWKKLPGRLPAAAIYYATSSHGLAEDVQHLLLRLGIWSTIRTVPQGTHRVNYHIHVQSAPVQKRFLDLVGSYGTRGAIVAELKEALEKIAPIPNKVARALESESLLHLAESDVYWDEVISIVPLGREEVFDMTVPGTHNFVAGDVVVHNSIEQDADVVMFIHREDKRNPESDRPNIAEILIEKHRNGPTGKTELYFDEKRATFQPVDKSGYGELASEF